MRSALWLATVISFGLPSSSRAEPALIGEAEIVRLLDAGRLNDAVQKIDQLVDQRLPTGKTVAPDPVLDRLVGEVLVRGFPSIAHDLLARSVDASSTADRMRYSLLLATADEALGEVRAAEARYAAVAAETTDPSRKAQAVAGEVRLLMSHDAAAATRRATTYLAAQAEPRWRWEAELLTARAARLQGRSEEARAALDIAAQHGWYGLPGDLAIQRVAAERAVVAGLGGDRPTAIALTAIGADTGWSPPALDVVPSCGTAGVRPDDFVVVEFVAAPLRLVRAELIAASRPEIVAAFMAALVRPAGQGDAGQVRTALLRCSTAPHVRLSNAPAENPIMKWSASLGAYPVLGQGNNQGFAAAAARLGEREARVGSSSVLLVPILAHLLSRGAEVVDDQAGREKLLGYAERLQAILVAQRAPADARLSAGLTAVALQLSMQRLAQSEAVARVRVLVLKATRSGTLSDEALLAIGGGIGFLSAGGREFEADVAAQSLATLSKRLAPTDSRRRALALRLARLRRDLGDEAGARTLKRDNGLPSGLCVAAAQIPRFLSSDIRPEDYPDDAIAANLRGAVSLEFTIDGDGRVQTPRALAEQPPFIFTPATFARAPTIRYEPARFAGRAVTCTAMSQTVRWQLPD